MKNTEKNLSEQMQALGKRGRDYLSNELGYSERVATSYQRVWRRLFEFMQNEGLSFYDDLLVPKFLEYKFGKKSKKDLTNHQRVYLNGVRMIVEYNKSGHINLPSTTPTRPKEPLIFKGTIGKNISIFISHKRDYDKLSKVRLRCYERNLFLFSEFCSDLKLKSVEAINLPVLLDFLKDISEGNKTAVYVAISILRNLMKYWYNQGYTDTDYSSKIPKYKTIQQSKLPSTYSKKEVNILLKTVLRNSATGKRNYAILLFAARLGMRASDIANLKFSYFDWEQNTLSFDQIKTGRRVTLPILADIGNALIDYLKYGRPQSDSPFVFLTARPPYGRFTSSNIVTHVVQRAFQKSGIKTSGRRFGPHALRHSLGFELLQNSTILPVISEVLGHKSTESTRYYLRIDLNSMQQCMLEVPPVLTSFYEQKGGIFYEK